MGNGARDYGPVAAHGVGQPRSADYGTDDSGHGGKLGQEHDGVYPGETQDVRAGATHLAGQTVVIKQKFAVQTATICRQDPLFADT